MLTKLDMIDTQVVLMNSIEWCLDDVINDDTAGQFRLELSIFRTFGYSNLISLRLMFIKLYMVSSQPVLTNLMEWRHDDVISDDTPVKFWLEFSIFRTCKYNNLINLHQMFTKLDMIDNQVVLTNFI